MTEGAQQATISPPYLPHISREVGLLSALERAELTGRGGSYLRFLEPCLEGRGRQHAASSPADAGRSEKLRG